MNNRILTSLRRSLWLVMPITLTSCLGAWFTTLTLRYFLGDRELTMWRSVYSGASGESYALPGLILGLILLLGPLVIPILFITGIIPKPNNPDAPEPSDYLSIYMLTFPILVLLVLVLDLESFKLFWSDLSCRVPVDFVGLFVSCP
jgi:hypothetical protein